MHTHINLCFRSKAPLAWKLHLPFVEWSLGCWISQVCCCCFRPSVLLAVLRCSQPRTTEYCFCWSLFIGDLWLPVNHRTLLSNSVKEEILNHIQNAFWKYLLQLKKKKKFNSDVGNSKLILVLGTLIFSCLAIISASAVTFSSFACCLSPHAERRDS